MVVCPACGRLVHADQLTSLAQEAKAAADRGDITGALTLWREALVLLPPGSRQHQVIVAKITELGKDVPMLPPTSKPAAGSKGGASRAAASLGAIGLVFWKLEALLIGLSKGTTLWSMLLSMGVYWTIWGWKFAVGLVLSIYVHEMGHVIALKRYGFKATSPMFIPGIGALIRLQQQVVNPLEDAEIGLAGPIYGLGAAVFSLALWYATGNHFFAAIAGVGAWINLFNLVPISSLDGGRGYHAMSRLQKFLCAATVAGAWWLANDPRHGRDGLLMLVAIVCTARAIGDKSVKDGSWKATTTYVMLVIALTAIAMVRHKVRVD